MENDTANKRKYNISQEKRKEYYKRYYEKKGREQKQKKYIGMMGEEKIKKKILILESLGYTVIPPI
jgi:hypothetical protein